LAEETIEDIIVNKQQMDEVKFLLSLLPDPQREVLTMRYYRNMSFKEIAEVTNVSINTALGRMRYGILNLRRLAVEYSIILTA
jgi:RNA polymerase sigma-70 factor (ECF subfamily)